MVVFYADQASGGGFSPTGTTLVLPSLTIGNVGQLSIDLLISTANVRRVGFLEDEYVIPMAGNDTFSTNQGKLSCAVEVFQNAGGNITFIQQRSPVVQGYNKIYAKKLVEWIKQCQFSEVILLASADASYRNDVQLSGQQVRYIANGPFAKNLDCGIGTPLESKSLDLLLKKGNLTEKMVKYNECVENGISILIVAIFCSEGDNIFDSIQLTDAVNNYLHVVDEKGTSKWKPPNSWTLIQGAPFDTSLFQ